MKDTTKKLLLQFDEIDQFETPKKFNYDVLNSKTIQLTKQLNKAFSLDFEIDYGQDASFFCEIKIPREIVDGKENFWYVIRISNFGYLATLNFEESYSKIILSKIITELENAGFHYVSADELEETYDGKFTAFAEILGNKHGGVSWWIRYFDYL